MKERDFDLEGFRDHLQQLEKELSDGVKRDPDYQGEVDDVIGALQRLAQEFKDKKYQKVLPDLFNVLEFLEMLQDNFEMEDFDDEEFDEDEFEEEEFEGKKS
jgi:hypothetical protein